MTILTMALLAMAVLTVAILTYMRGTRGRHRRRVDRARGPTLPRAQGARRRRGRAVGRRRGDPRGPLGLLGSGFWPRLGLRIGHLRGL